VLLLELRGPNAYWALDALETPKARPLDDVLSDYLAHLRVHAKPRSLSEARVHTRHLLRVLGAKANAGSPRIVEQFIAARVGEGVERATINGSLRILRAALRYAVETKKITEAPRVQLLRVGRKIPRILGTNGDLERLLAHATPPVDLVLLIAAYSGLRHSEIRHLQRRDVDLRNDTLHVSVKPEVGWSPKSHHERMVPLHGRLRERLQLHLSDVPEAPSAWLFPGPHPQRPRASFIPAVRATFKAADLYSPRLGLHTLRKTWASALLANGASIETVRELGGWSDLGVLMAYLASTAEHRRAAIETLDRE
jgi:integrase